MKSNTFNVRFLFFSYQTYSKNKMINSLFLIQRNENKPKFPKLIKNKKYIVWVVTIWTQKELNIA